MTIETLAHEFGFDKVGIIGPEHANGPSWTRAVLVLALATLDPAFDHEMFIEYDGRRSWHKFVYVILEAQGARLAHALREKGLRAEPLTFEDSISYINLREAAVQAGLGVRGLNEAVVTTEYGPRVRFTALFTDAELEQDHPLREYYCLNCTLCWSACPTGAIGPQGFDRSRCIAEFAPTPEMAERQREIQTFPTPATRLQCRKCLDSCPIGERQGTFYFDIVP
ncbi:MAG: 4Fe-4S double cluster binding domain-containing protein [Chloroflexota bacterium]|nr:4Fe-4S double cluster binding domain-containing protein [Chloroflexota bacterium]